MSVPLLSDVSEDRRGRCGARPCTEATCGALFDLVNDAVFIHDPETGAVVDVNQRAEELYGATRDELCALPLHALSEGTPPYSRREAEAVLRAAAAGTPQLFEWHARTRAGAPFWVEINIKRVLMWGCDRLVAVVRDVTDRKRAEAERERLLASVNRRAAELEATFAAMADGAVVYDADARILRMNRAAEDMLGATAHTDASRMPLEERLSVSGVETPDGAPFPPDETPARKALRGVTARGVRMVLHARSSEARWVSASAAPIRGRAGKIVGAVATFTDVTDQKTYEHALRAANERLRDADRRKDEFLGVLSHELRNPLAPIRNGVYVLERAPRDPERAARATEVIRRQTDHLARLVDDLLDVTRISRGKIHLQLSRFDLGEVVRRTCADHASVFERGEVRLDVALPPAPVPVDGDETRVAQVVGNLLSNAAKFTPGGGRVEVELACRDGVAELTLSDTGVGISPADLERVFEPFEQGAQDLARGRGGLGLGLSLVKGLLELHGGTVSAASGGAGRGTRLIVRIPSVPPRELEPQPPPAARAETRADGVVLIIEDNVDAGDTLAEVLALEGHRVRVARDGRSGIALARELRPQIVLCDIGLPDITGYEVARTLRSDARLASVRLVALSGYTQPEDRRRAAEAGFDAHVAKPPSLQELETLIQRAPSR